MRHYEIIIIVHPSVPEEELSLVTDKVTSFIKQHRGEVIKLDQWGKRKCAHTINKCVKGYYFVLCFTADPAILTDLEKTLRYDEKVLRYQVVRVEKPKTAAPPATGQEHVQGETALQSEAHAADQ